jgi:adenosylhomocysteine nucleosidase
MKKVLMIFALPEEVIQVEWENCKIIPIVSRIGKACAAIAVTKAILSEHPDIVINIGSAGTLTHAIGDIIVSTHFEDRDFAQTELPDIVYEYCENNAYENSFPSIIKNKEVWKNDFIVNTGDDFVTTELHAHGDVFDMESFAELLACRSEGVPFISIKYITDIIGQNSIKLWAEKLEEARASLTEYFKKYTL